MYHNFFCNRVRKGVSLPWKDNVYQFWLIYTRYMKRDKHATLEKYILVHFVWNKRKIVVQIHYLFVLGCITVSPWEDLQKSVIIKYSD